MLLKDFLLYVTDYQNVIIVDNDYICNYSEENVHYKGVAENIQDLVLLDAEVVGVETDNENLLIMLSDDDL